MNKYKTHNCGELRSSNIGNKVKLAGWINRKRDLGGLCFVDLRDHFGMTQFVFDKNSSLFATIDNLRVESVVSIEGEVVARQNVNKNIATGDIEITANNIEVHSSADVLPIQVAVDDDSPEELRLKYRFLDLRREKLHQNIILRAKVISAMRRLMEEQGFTEFQTPILTSSSPEGARDFLVPSRVHPGKFYALPQAPQQFKQLIMVAGFNKYFQIAPCFRDEDPRADRCPGEFYQLDLEMSFATQEDVFAAVEYVIGGVFKEFAIGKKFETSNFVRITYKESMLKYGNDKPDLRNPLIIQDATDFFGTSGFAIYDDLVNKGKLARAIVVEGIAENPRSFFDKLDAFAKEEDMGGMAYIALASGGAKGFAKLLSAEKLEELKNTFGVKDGDAVFFMVGDKKSLTKFSGKARTKIAVELNLVEKDAYRFCWVIDFPMYELDDETGKIDFLHNPFSMPQGGLDDLLNKDPLDILAYQYDIVCNGIELSSGAVRNHLPEIMYKAFEIVGHGKEVVDEKFGGMINAFKFGAPPHAGCAPGVDRTIMLLLNEPTIREAILFPMNGKAQDLMMQAPSTVTDAQLKELHIKTVV